jgi:hypothetical protein
MYFYIEFWRFHCHSPVKDIFKVLIRKKLMVMLKKFYFFTHIKSLIIFLFVDFFTFIFPFKAQSYAWTILRISNMSFFNLLRLLDVCRWMLVFILFLAIDTCGVKGWKVAHRIFVHKKD